MNGPRRFESVPPRANEGPKTVDTCEGPFTICAPGLLSLRRGDSRDRRRLRPFRRRSRRRRGDCERSYPPTAIDSRHHAHSNPGASSSTSNPDRFSSAQPRSTTTRCWLFMQVASTTRGQNRTPAGFAETPDDCRMSKTRSMWRSGVREPTSRGKTREAKARPSPASHAVGSVRQACIAIETVAPRSPFSTDVTRSPPTSSSRVATYLDPFGFQGVVDSSK